MSKVRYPRSVTVRMTGEMYANLRRLATDDRKVALVVREAVRHYLDDQAEIAGSRRHFGGRFKERIDRLERLVSSYALVTISLLVHVGELSAARLDRDPNASVVTSKQAEMVIKAQRMAAGSQEFLRRVARRVGETLDAFDAAQESRT